MTADDGPFGSSVDIGVSDAFILAVSVIGFFILAGTVYSIILMRVQTRDEFEKEHGQNEMDYGESLQQADVSTLTRSQRRARAKHIMKQQRRVVPTDQQDADALEEDLVQQQDASTQHLSRKERQKAAKEAEKLARQTCQEERRQQQKETVELAKKKKRERQERQAKAMEEAKRKRQVAAEQQERAAHEQWKTFLASEEERMTVDEFREYCEEHKVVDLNALSARFRVPLLSIKDRLQNMVSERRLTGIVTEDNKFLLITEKELDQMAALVLDQQEGSLEDLAPKLTKLTASCT